MLRNRMLVCVLLLAAPLAAGAQSQGVHRIRVGSNVQAAKILKQVQPVYPPAAVEGKISGTVMLHAVIATDGSVKEVSYMSGPQELSDSAVEAVRQWQYQQTLLQGEPVEIDTTISVVYRLSESGEATVLDGQQEQRESIQRIRVDGNVQAAKMIRQVQPKYPKAAKKAGIIGTVILHAVIATDGSIQQLNFVSGPPELMGSAMDAVRKWQYQPTMLQGKPVEVDTTISIIYTLGK